MDRMIKVYMKKCDTCGLQYFGHTISAICESSIEYPDYRYYKGSGVKWGLHIEYHKTHKTKVLFESADRSEVESYCKAFSKSNPKYWETNLYANKIEEDGKETIGSMQAHPRWKDGGKSYLSLGDRIQEKFHKVVTGELIKYTEKTLEWEVEKGKTKRLRTKEVIVTNTDRVDKVICEDVEKYINQAEVRMISGKDDASLSSGYREFGPRNLSMIEHLLKLWP